MNQLSSVFGLFGVAMGLFAALVGVIYRSVVSRVQSLESQVGRNRDLFNGKTPIIYASEQRLNDIEKRLDRLENNVMEFMRRIEEKIDELQKQA